MINTSGTGKGHVWLRPRSRSQAIGHHGENLAAKYLQKQGFTLIERNWRSPRGELDLIALDGSTLVVCEVKTRTTDQFGGPLAAITPTKLRRLRSLAGEWLGEHPIHVDGVRIDVVAISLIGRGQPEVEHLVGVH